VLLLVVSLLKLVCCDFSIFSAVMPRSPVRLFNLVRNSVVHSPSSVIRDPRYWKLDCIYLLQLLILNEYAACYAVAHHYLGLVDVDEQAVFTAASMSSA